jgi:hypothetical protein
VSATNPLFTGTVIPTAYAPLTADAGSLVTIELAWSMTGPPVETIVPPSNGALAEVFAEAG